MRRSFLAGLALAVAMLPLAYAGTVVGAGAGPLHTLTINLTPLALDSTTVSGVHVQCYTGTGYTNGQVTGILKPLKVQSIDSLTPTSITVRVGTDAGAMNNVSCAVSGGSESTGVQSLTVSVNTGTAYTLQSTDTGKVLSFTSSSPVTLTVPQGLPTGFSCTIDQAGTGAISVISSGSAAVTSFNGLISTAGQYAQASLYQISSNTFRLTGNLQ
jgi:hypothetical protein